MVRQEGSGPRFQRRRVEGKQVGAASSTLQDNREQDSVIVSGSPGAADEDRLSREMPRLPPGDVRYSDCINRGELVVKDGTRIVAEPGAVEMAVSAAVEAQVVDRGQFDCDRRQFLLGRPSGRQVEPIPDRSRTRPQLWRARGLQAPAWRAECRV